jgi:DNA polymerase IV
MDENRIRKIIHIDMDAFYASVEQRDHPALEDRAVAVGYPAKRGVAATASYEARRFGFRSAMPSTVTVRRCQELVFVPPRFDVYRVMRAGGIRGIDSDCDTPEKRGGPCAFDHGGRQSL